jgi:hypothetical protein
MASIYILGDDKVYPNGCLIEQSYASKLQLDGHFVHSNFVFSNTINKVCRLKGENFFQDDFDLMVIDLGLFDAVVAYKSIFSQLASFYKQSSTSAAGSKAEYFLKLHQRFNPRFRANIDNRLLEACIKMLLGYAKKHANQVVWLEQTLPSYLPVTERYSEKNKTKAEKHLQKVNQLIKSQVGEHCFFKLDVSSKEHDYHDQVYTAVKEALA